MEQSDDAFDGTDLDALHARAERINQASRDRQAAAERRQAAERAREQDQ
jgi:hypothetical protein